MAFAEEYLETQVMTATPYRLHLMVLDGALRFARQAEQALVEGDTERAFSALDRSRDCVSELLGGLDATHAPELVERLKGLLVFVFRNLSLADVEQNVQRVRDAVRILEIHRETWLELAEKLATDPVPETVPTVERSWST